MITLNKLSDSQWTVDHIDCAIVSYIRFINSKGILGMRGKKKEETIFGSILGWKESIFFNPSFHIVNSTIFPI